MEQIKAQRGTKDILPGKSGSVKAEEISECWQAVEEVMREEAAVNGFSEIRTPVFEDTRLFRRSVGETTDVVQKEMYTFEDKGKRSVTLKPEGTAGVVRSYLEHGLYNSPAPQKFYYLTPCYRYEKAQAGRQREFHQFGVEIFGTPMPLADAGLIAFAHGLFDRLCVKGLKLKINSIGCPDCRAEYSKALKAYFTERKDRLCETCLSRLERNPMRILDCKEPDCAEAAKDAPRILDYLCDDCRAHFDGVKSALDSVHISYEIDPAIVRGLDYYTRTVFEFVSSDLGAQSTVCGGGRYDGLVEEMGGKPTPALGFGLGLERLLMVMQAQKVEFPEPQPCELYIASIGEAAQRTAFRMAQGLRECSVAAFCDEMGRSLNAQMKYADKLGAQFTLVVGDDELDQGLGVIKNMKTGEKTKVNLNNDFEGQFAAISAQAEDDESLSF
ncbi:histidine--tRNA ligase [Caproiciproducens sp. NJN-50]|uniref:histidine--tRNA ligase n=1 Tax=Acutalibacteraceae TaxID=3082771 RepID=UPI000FFE18D0|nr:MULTISPECIES: histidine--tRNA ligase [Acutalibacteraceae]QAT51024.1 histidine--tRNA ligase [Caproiciproducens sp. NJN-50]